MRGAAVSVDPVTETLPVVPVSVHSGVPPPPGAAVGQVLSVVAGPGAGGVAGSAITDELADPEDVLADGADLWELHPASMTTADAPQAASATEGYTRKKFTVVTLQPRSSSPKLSWHARTR